MPPKITTEILRTPECVECFENINTHANYVFGMFEVDSKESIEKHDKEFTEHLERREKRDNRNSNYNLLILTLFASVIAYSYIRQNEFENRITILNNEKANKTEFVTKPEFEIITQQGDEYNKNIFVKKTEITADTFSYPMNKERLFGEVSRGTNTNKISEIEQSKITNDSKQQTISRN